MFESKPQRSASCGLDPFLSREEPPPPSFSVPRRRSRSTGEVAPILAMINAREAQLAKVSGRYPVSSRRSCTGSALNKLGRRVSFTYRRGHALLGRLLPTFDRRSQGCSGHPGRGAGLTGPCGFPATEGPPPPPLAEVANRICCSVYAAKDRSNVSTMLL